MSLKDLIAALAGEGDRAVVVTDAMLAPPGPNILYVNAAFERMTGYTRAELVGNSPRMLQGPGTSLAARKRLAKALRDGERHATVLINYRKSGEAYRCAIEVFPILSPSGELVNAVALEQEVETRPGRRPGRLSPID